MSTQPTFDIADLIAIAENVDPNDVVETEDYSDDLVLPVGYYLNPSREIASVTSKPDKKNPGKETVTVRLNLTGGLFHEDGRSYGGKFAFPYWINSSLFARDGRPGMTSGIAEYLKAVGVETKGMALGDMLSILPETLNTPCEFFAGLTDKGVKDETTGQWSQANLKLKDFKTGAVDDNGKPVYSRTVEKNGVLYHAKTKIQGVRAVR